MYQSSQTSVVCTPAAPVIPTLTAEEITGRYGKVSTLGKGAFGKAYLIKELSTGKLLVLKQIAAKKGSNGAEREASLLSTLDHPNIVRFCDAFWTSGGRLCLVMTYCDGGDLHSLLKRQAPGVLLSEKTVLGMFVQICCAVQYIHSRRIIHRDLKSSNVFLMTDGRISLGDFGISRVLERTKELARTLVGTPYFLAPEILMEGGYSFPCDVWSAGIVLYEMATLKQPFQATNIAALTLRIMKGDYDDPDETKFSPDLRGLIRAMLKQDPEKRPTINQILRMPFLAKPIRDVLTKFPFINFRVPDEEEEHITQQLSPINAVPCDLAAGLTQRGRDGSAVNLSGISEAPTVKFSDEAENEYAEDFEDYNEDEEGDEYFPENDEAMSEIFNYIADQIGYEKSEKLFQLIQRRVNLEIPDDAFRQEALKLLEDQQLVDRILPLAEAAVFLSYAPDENCYFCVFYSRSKHKTSSCAEVSINRKLSSSSKAGQDADCASDCACTRRWLSGLPR